MPAKINSILRPQCLMRTLVRGPNIRPSPRMEAAVRIVFRAIRKLGARKGYKPTVFLDQTLSLVRRMPL